jgi:hypothetical protein
MYIMTISRNCYYDYSKSDDEWTDDKTPTIQGGIIKEAAYLSIFNG